MNPLRQRMIEDMQLRGLSEKTQDAYGRAVRQLAAYYAKSPDQISEEELRQYLLYPKKRKKGSLERLQDCAVRDQVFLHAHAATAVGHLRSGACAKRKAAADGVEP